MTIYLFSSCAFLSFSLSSLRNHNQSKTVAIIRLVTFKMEALQSLKAAQISNLAPAFYYIPNFITEEEEATLLTKASKRRVSSSLLLALNFMNTQATNTSSLDHITYIALDEPNPPPPTSSSGSLDSLEHPSPTLVHHPITASKLTFISTPSLATPYVPNIHTFQRSRGLHTPAHTSQSPKPLPHKRVPSRRGDHAA